MQRGREQSLRVGRGPVITVNGVASTLPMEIPTTGAGVEQGSEMITPTL
jgi:hypothetical protein